MAMLKTDKLIAAPRGTLSETILAFRKLRTVKRWSNFVEYVETVFSVAPRVGLDPSIVIAQASHETDYFRSFWWETRLNPAGLGINGNPEDEKRSRFFRNGHEAARGQMAHLLLYATGKVAFPLLPGDDPRYDAYIQAYGQAAKADTIEGLAQTWATSESYHVGICRHGNELYPNLPESSRVKEQEIFVAQGAVPLRVGGITWDGRSDVTINGILFHGERRSVTVGVDVLNVRVYASSSSYSPVLYTVTNGQQIPVIGWVTGEKVGSENRWWVGLDHTRIWVGGTEEKPT